MPVSYTHLFLPEEYIPDAAGRIEAYKRIAAIETTADAEDVLDELIDRYGRDVYKRQGLVAAEGVMTLFEQVQEFLAHSYLPNW